jgi:kinesin family protein 18/19
VRPLSPKELSIIELDTVKVLDSKMVVLLDPENEFSTDVKLTALHWQVLKKNRTKDLSFAFDVVFDRNVD